MQVIARFLFLKEMSSLSVMSVRIEKSQKLLMV